MNTARNVPELFGSMVFNETVMKERLPKDVYRKLKKTMREGTANRCGRCRRCGDSDERLGALQGRNALYPLVPAARTAFRPKSMIPLSLRRTTAA